MLHIAAFRLTDTLLSCNYLVVLRVTTRGCGGVMIVTWITVIRRVALLLRSVALLLRFFLQIATRVLAGHSR